jgi:hypothetical protein
MALRSPRGQAVADLRNKIRKLEEPERIRAMQRRIEATMPRPQPIRCQCGLTPAEVPVMWGHQADRWSALRFYRPACLPAHLCEQAL